MSGNPVKNTLMVWKALFLKDALSRFFGSRGAWAWLFIEPCIHIGIMVVLFTVIRTKVIGGVDVATWIMVGMIGFFLFRRTSVQGIHALDCNRAFFAFRQVRPFDTALTSAVVELFTMFWTFLILLIAFALFGFSVIPENTLLVIFGALGLWLLGLGYGLISSVCMRIVRDSGHFLQILMMPMYFISGVIIPMNTVPEPYRSYVALNPVLHGIELMRKGYWPNYHTLDVSFSYLYGTALILLVIGMGLYRSLETRLVTQ